MRALEIAILRGDVPLPAPVGYPAPVLGLQLTVDPSMLRLRIAARARAQFDAGLLEIFRPTPESSDAVANQTAGGESPMLFTYTMDIFGRMIAPQQDTPAIRITWSGCITTNYGMRRCMWDGTNFHCA